MATRTLRIRNDDDPYQSQPEQAPSAVREGAPASVQALLYAGFFLALVGALAIGAPIFGYQYFFKPGSGYFCATIGLAMMLAHCFLDGDAQFRWMYGTAALALIGGAGATRVWPGSDGVTGKWFLPLGVPMLFVALLFLVGVIRHEKQTKRDALLRRVLVAVAAALLLFGFLGGYRDGAFLAGEGIVLLLLGFAYAVAFVALWNDREGDFGFRAAQMIGAIGVVNLVVTVGRCVAQADYLVPSGLILLGVSGLFCVYAFLACCDWPFAVLTRRELLGFFFSPIAYLVLFGLLVMFGLHFWIYASQMQQMNVTLEPIVQRYVFSLFPVVAVMALAPLLTMRLVSEEKRTGSIELLLTAPIGEWTVALSKFAAALTFFLIAWSPFFLFLVSLRIFGDAEFDYRPALSFFVALVATGASFVAMGLFFSSVTSNQIVAAVLTFAGMMVHLGILFLREFFRSATATEFLRYVSYIDLWGEASSGYLAPAFLLFHASCAFFFVYLTKVALTARRWK